MMLSRRHINAGVHVLQIIVTLKARHEPRALAHLRASGCRPVMLLVLEQ